MFTCAYGCYPTINASKPCIFDLRKVVGDVTSNCIKSAFLPLPVEVEGLNGHSGLIEEFLGLIILLFSLCLAYKAVLEMVKGCTV